MAEQSRREAGQRLTVEEFGDLWTSGKLYEQHGEVNKLRPKATADDDEYRLKKYVYPKIGSRPVADIAESDIEHVLNEASRKQGPKWRAKLHVYQAMRRLFDLAIMPGRIRKDNPVSRYLRPGRTKPKLFGYLYPSELLALLHCSDVPIARRVLYALAVYTGLRKSSLYALTWGGVDFENRTLTSLESKTDLPQMFEVHASLSQLLAHWYEHRGRPKSDAPIVVVSDVERRGEREGETLRDDLTAAKVTRQALHERKANASPMRFHDLRATFVTWAMREGRGDGWISDRTGHLTPEMRARYARAARTLLDLNYQPFPDVSAAIPELLEQRDNVISLGASKALNA
jgi:integrase